MKILGIDYGLSRIGLAKAEDNVVEPLNVILNDLDVLKKIKKICEENKIDKIVVGISEGEIAKKSEKFAQTILSNLKLPIDFYDETLTTHEAVVKMIETGKKKKFRRKKKDAFAAACLLQDYLNERG